jgi:hypothetical protein
MTVKETGVLEWRSDGRTCNGVLVTFNIPCASLSGRRRLSNSDTRAFSPGFNMTGLRPCWLRVYSAASENARRGKRWVGKRVDLGKGGKMEGTLTGFSHLFPDDSMQVVDFPHLARLSIFWEMRKNHGDTEAQPRKLSKCDGQAKGGKELTTNHAKHTKPQNKPRSGAHGLLALPLPRSSFLATGRAAKCA